MKNYNYNGYIKADYAKIAKWNKSFFSNIIEKSKSEFILKGKNKEVYIYDDFNNGFLFSAEFSGTFEEAQEFINTIVESLKNSGISYYQFEWNEVDKDGNQIGEEYETKS